MAWITDRFPEHEDWVWVSCNLPDGSKKVYEALHKNGRWFWKEAFGGKRILVAWQEIYIPEPYEEENDTKTNARTK